jgi:hypothetical protein
VAASDIGSPGAAGAREQRTVSPPGGACAALVARRVAAYARASFITQAPARTPRAPGGEVPIALFRQTVARSTRGIETSVGHRTPAAE